VSAVHTEHSVPVPVVPLVPVEPTVPVELLAVLLVGTQLPLAG
jgi:hypothetical protein